MRYVAALLCAGILGTSAPGWADAEHHHRHEAPHGGTLLVFGDELAHLELVLESDAGELHAWVLDGAAERGVPISQVSSELEVVPPDGDPFRVELAAVENVLTGEAAGRSSEFAGRSARLVGLDRFQGVIRELEVRGWTFRAVRFRFPEGNEDPTHRDAGAGSPPGASAREEDDHAGSEEEIR